MNFDEQFENRIRAILSDEYEEFVESLDSEKITALRINSLKAFGSEKDDENSVKECLIESGTKFISDVKWEPDGFIYKEGAPGKHPLHEAGAYYIQEPSAMAPVHYLDPRPGEKILDLCAAPGGKSTQIASYMKGEGVLVSNEIDKKRAQILSLNIERCGVRNALVTNMEPKKLSHIFEGYFDKILVDAPCSGEGMFRKNDEAVTNWSIDNIRLCAQRQTEIIKEAVKMLAPGGRLVYSTCTFAPEEDEYQAAKILSLGLKPVRIELFDGMVSGNIDNLKRVIDISEDEVIDKEFVLELPQDIIDDVACCSGRLWPHKIKGEGHFFAVFEKTGDIELNAGVYNINGKIKAPGIDDIEPFANFAKEFLGDVRVVLDDAKNTRDQSEKSDKKSKKGKRAVKGLKNTCRIEGAVRGTPFMLGEQLYLAGEGMPGINGITVMRPGLHLGTIKNGRFEPSHSLALALSKTDAKYAFELESEQKAMEFIGGISFREQNLEKGWYLITYLGYTLGWAKYAGGILKNHYPKGLRIYT